MHLQEIDALATNETLFFRDRYPFDALATDVLPHLIRARQYVRRTSIWSAAASTGQEAYSIARLIREKFPELCSWSISILGTDLSATVLTQVRAGSYFQSLNLIKSWTDIPTFDIVLARNVLIYFGDD